MFSYSPQTQDRSGEIIGAGMMGAAETQANAMAGIGQNIGSALQAIGGMYGEAESRKAKGRAFKKTMEVMGPSLGMTSAKLKAAFGDVKTDMDYANLSDSLMPVLPSWVNATLGYGRLGVQRNSPLVDAGLDGAASVAGGEGTVPLPVEPPLPEPTGSSTQPSQPSPDAVSASSAWYNQSKGNGGMTLTGGMRPFYRTSTK